LVYILAIPATILIIVGIILAVPKLFRACQSCWLLILGSVFIMFIGLIYMQLRLPYSGQAKAFYGLFMALPAGLLFAYGFDFINNYLKHLKFARAFFYAWFGLLAVSILMAFHVSKTVNVDTRADSRHLNQAIENCKLFIQRNPDSRAGYSTLAYFYSKQSRFDEAVLYYKKAFEMGEKSPEILLEYSSAILNKSSLTDDDKLEALRYARLSCEMSGYLDSFSVLNLAEAYKSVGKIPDAMKMARRAHELALSAGQMNIVELARQKIKDYASLSQTKLVEGSSENRNH
jgi:tetratricopeptide (TPR) repeat protein